MNRLQMFALAGLSLATVVPAQTLSIRGEVDQGRSTGCYYCPNIPYTIKFSETPLRSSTVNLQVYKDLSAQLIMTGTWNATAVPPGFDVTAVQLAEDSLDVNNNAQIGTPLRYTVYGPPGSLAGTFVAFGSAFVPLFGSTALLLDPGSLVSLGSANLDAGGRWRFNLPVPANPNLIGFRFWSQAVVVPQGAPVFTTNPMVTVIEL